MDIKSACIKELGRHNGFQPNKLRCHIFLTPAMQVETHGKYEKVLENRVTGKEEVSSEK